MVSRAFTLIELLAVITIIGILAAIIIPVVGRVRQSAADATCKSNVRQLTMAYVMFLNDHKMLSLPNTVNNTNEWSAYSNEGVGQGTFHGFYLLRWYYKPGPNRIRLSGTKYLYEKIEHCPSVRMNGLTQDPTMMAAQKSDYGVRQPPSETVEGVTRVKLVNFGLCTQPSRTPLVFDHFQGAWKTGGGDLETHLPLRHRGKRSINCGFLDGHVAYVDGDEKDGRLYMQYWRGATMNQEPDDNDLRKGSALGLTEMPAAPSESGG
ncbi:MAG: prepilin-type N-terminal cleavage/methylation domain-containing protein [Opitutaceae bacterium]|nr:prepilin-type N-terminal cleavage/methylation domain-containing protein [Opitutaceae bacterium]